MGFIHPLEAGGLGPGLRWTSRENILIGCEDGDEEDPQLFVALYDFQAGGENQLSLKKGEQVSRIKILSPNLVVTVTLNPISLFTYHLIWSCQDIL